MIVSTWRRLNSYEGFILVSYEASSSSYKLLLTDASTLWTHSLDRRGIIQKALAEDTSIDPSEDASQMQFLLSTLRKVCEQAAGTDFKVSSADGGKTLDVELTAPLPASLPALVWRVKLAQASGSALASEFVLPLLHENALRAHETASLLCVVAEKDTVMGKVVDQVVSDGMNLGKTFPGILASHTSKTADYKAMLAKHIKGIAPFNKQSWHESVSREDSKRMGLASSNQGNSVITLRASGDGFSATNESWWESIPRQRKAQDHSAPDDAMHKANETFKRQSTPPALSKKHGPNPSPVRQKQESADKQVLDSDSTTDDEDDVETVQGNASGDKSSQKTAPSPPSAPSPFPAHDPEPERNQSPNPPPWTLTKRPKLGKIGGKSNKPASSAEQHAGAAGKASMSSKSTPDESVRDREVKRTQSSTDSPRENSLDRANRNRERLKRDLDEKSRSGIKKKRKF